MNSCANNFYGNFWATKHLGTHLALDELYLYVYKINGITKSILLFGQWNDEKCLRHRLLISEGLQLHADIGVLIIDYTGQPVADKVRYGGTRLWQEYNYYLLEAGTTLGGKYLGDFVTSSDAIYLVEVSR